MMNREGWWIGVCDNGFVGVDVCRRKEGLVGIWMCCEFRICGRKVDNHPVLFLFGEGLIGVEFGVAGKEGKCVS